MNCIKMFASDLPLLILTDHFLYGTPCYIDSLGEYYNIVWGKTDDEADIAEVIDTGDWIDMRKKMTEFEVQLNSPVSYLKRYLVTFYPDVNTSEEAYNARVVSKINECLRRPM